MLKKYEKYILSGLLLTSAGLAIAYTINRFTGSVTVPALFMSLRWLMVLFLVLFCLVKQTLTTWIFSSMIIGAVIGYDFPESSYPNLINGLKVLGGIFLRLIKTIVAPLLFGTLVVGIAGHSDLKQVGRMGWKSLLYFEVMTTFALIIGLLAINLTQIGVDTYQHPTEISTSIVQKPVAKQTASEIILHIFPENFAKAVAEGQILQVVVFSVLFAIALSGVKEKLRLPMLRFAESLSDTMFKFTNLVMLFAPFAVGGAIAYTVGHFGLSSLFSLLKLLALLYASLIVFVLGVLLPVALIARLPIRRFIKAVTEPVSIAFATTSSEAALPRAMEKMEIFGVPQKIVAFVMPTGYSFNLDGTTLYLSLATIFVAQAGGIHLTIGEQIVMLLTLMLTSKGVAGVPRASFVILLGTAEAFNLPTGPVFMIFAIDALMDMARTAVNVLGNCLATAVVARWEGELDTSGANDAV